jgi:hypothetical protein
MKAAIIIVGIAAALAAVAVAVLGLISLREQAREAKRPATWDDVARIRELVLGVDRRAAWVAWLTTVNALLGLLVAAAVLMD